MDLTPLLRFARLHHQLISRRVAGELGMSKSAWYWALDSQRFEQIHPGVARLAGAVSTPEQRILAAVWACGDGTLASHRSSAHLWVPRSPPQVVDVIVRDRRRGLSLPGVIVHRPSDLGDLRPSYPANIAATNPLRMLADLGAVEPESVRSCLEGLVIAGIVTPGVVRAALERHRGRGRAGAVSLAQVLDDWTMNEKPPDSVLEEAMNALVLRFHLPPLEFHPIIAGYEPDFRVIGTNVLVECDGWATHGLQREQFEKDKERIADLTAAGYTVVQVTWRQIRRRQSTVAARLRAVIERVAPEKLVLGVHSP